MCLTLVGHGMVLRTASAGPRATPAAASELIAFDIPAQALASAIERYSVLTGWQVIYDASLAGGRRSAPLEGAFPPAAALRVLLAGTGLAPEYVSDDGVMLVALPTVAAPATAPPVPPPHLRDYYGRIQAGLARVFCADDLIRSGRYRIALGFWIGPSGSVVRAASLGSTGQAEVDAAFDRGVRRLEVGAPPADFEQPVVVLVTPELLGQCRTANPRPTRLAR
ncbi:MAG: secretin and TonB N-terminal domain-containing protein [Rhodoplanes sp.]|uniref:STN domain-containing protein n=1 Tax=Rhodoplanes sp. TaxID=1968906 RepID=UPI0017D9DA1D|nr:STN domain-containing protein [Rhodoplanes sp.]NVO17719.1 secretin and TonB N-terminal domain-containing protein [Rhodoplanes sp.]